MTDTKQSEASERKEAESEHTNAHVSVILVLAAVACVSIIFVGIMSFFLSETGMTTSQVVIVLAVLLAVLGTVAGASFLAIRASGETTREIARATKATGVYAEQLAKTKPANILEVAGAQTELLTSYYRTVLAQARESFRWALVAAGIGLLFFLGAVAFLLIVHLQSAATVTIIGGALIEVISGINFYVYGKSTTQLAMFHRRLDQTQRFLLANSVCESLEGEERQKARASLVHTIADPTLGQ